jgi:aspartyl-tRNA(Asn)/glutamyl-tRNA(Gln) amidotransferase subunit B
MVELPWVMAARFCADYGLPEYDAATLTQSRAMAAYFEATAKACAQPKLASNWIMGEVSRRLNESDKGLEQVPVSPAQLGALISRVSSGQLSNNSGKQLFGFLWVFTSLNIPDAAISKLVVDFKGFASINENAEDQIDYLIDTQGLRQMNDSSALEAIIDEVLAANAKNVDEYKAGNAKAFNALVGQAMKASKGKANPAQVNELLKQKLA